MQVAFGAWFCSVVSTLTRVIPGDFKAQLGVFYCTLHERLLQTNHWANLMLSRKVFFIISGTSKNRGFFGKYHATHPTDFGCIQKVVLTVAILTALTWWSEWSEALRFTWLFDSLVFHIGVSVFVCKKKETLCLGPCRVYCLDCSVRYCLLPLQFGFVLHALHWN